MATLPALPASEERFGCRAAGRRDPLRENRRHKNRGNAIVVVDQQGELRSATSLSGRSAPPSLCATNAPDASSVAAQDTRPSVVTVERPGSNGRSR